MGLTDDALEQVGRLFKENAELRERVEQVAAQRDEWHRQNGLLRGERDAATARAEKAEAELKRLAEVATRSVADLNPDDEWDEIEQLTELLAAATNRAEQAEAALAEMRERHDVLGQTRAEIAIELRNAARWHPGNAAWTQDMDQAARIVEVGMDAYAVENGLPRLGGFIRERADATPRTGLERAADEQGDGGN